VLLNCPRYSSVRNNLFDKLKDHIADFDTLDNDSKFIALMQNNNVSLMAKCIYDVFKIRSECINAGMYSVVYMIFLRVNV